MDKFVMLAAEFIMVVLVKGRAHGETVVVTNKNETTNLAGVDLKIMFI